MMDTPAQEKAKIKAGTSQEVDLWKMVGSLLKDHLTSVKRVRVPALTFTFPRGVARNYWSSFWGGHHLPLKFRIDGKVDKEMFIGRSLFATTFIIADSVYLVGRFGVWLLKKLPWQLNVLNVVVIAGLVVGFIGWGLPWFLDQSGFMAEIEQTKTMQALHDIDMEIPQVPEVELNVRWLALVPLVGMIGTLPFSVARFKKWRGFKTVLKQKSEPIIGGNQHENH